MENKNRKLDLEKIEKLAKKSHDWELVADVRKRMINKKIDKWQK